MIVTQKLAILIKNFYLSNQYGARRLLKLGSIDSLLKRIPKTSTIVRLQSRLLMLSSFQPFSGNSLNSLRTPRRFDR